MIFPTPPSCSQDIWTYNGPGEYLACAIVRNKTARQLMAYRKLRLTLGEQRFRELLIEAVDILSYNLRVRPH